MRNGKTGQGKGMQRKPDFLKKTSSVIPALKNELDPQPSLLFPSLAETRTDMKISTMRMIFLPTMSLLMMMRKRTLPHSVFGVATAAAAE